MKSLVVISLHITSRRIENGSTMKLSLEFDVLSFWEGGFITPIM